MKAPALFVALLLACDPAPPAERPAERPTERSGAAEPVDAITAPAAAEPFLARYDFDERRARFDLPGRLDEISGLAFSPDGRLFAHDDERGRVHQIDPVSGEVGKRFDLGGELLRDDLEGITVVGDRFFLISSTGMLYEFREGADGENVTYRRTDTGVGRHCEVEGLDYDPGHDELLVACKTTMPDRGTIVVHRLPIAPGIERPPPVQIARVGLPAFGLEAEFAPSAIAVTPAETWLLASARNDALIEVDRNGSILAAVSLGRRRHPQPEGLALGPDGTLWVADERNGDGPRLTGYGPR